MRLHINIDHVATIRQARRTDEPDPVRAAVLAELGGADGITAHLREDRRHIQERDLRLLLIPPTMRPLYHAAAVFASNYLLALLAIAVRLLQDAGVPADDALPAILPLMRGTLDNVQHLGVPAALTGPVARGDTDTIRLHLARLSGEDRELYCALGRELLPLARAAGLDERRAAELETLLTS